MTGAQLGKRLGMTAQGIVSLERSEASGTIQLNTLRRAAEAMDCGGVLGQACGRIGRGLHEGLQG